MEWIIIAEENVPKERLNPSKHPLAKVANLNEELLTMYLFHLLNVILDLLLFHILKGNYGKIVWATLLWIQSLFSSMPWVCPELKLSIQSRSSFHREPARPFPGAAGEFKAPMNPFILLLNP